MSDIHSEFGKSNVKIIVTCDKCGHKEEIGDFSWHIIVCANCKHEIVNDHTVLALDNSEEIHTLECDCKHKHKMCVSTDFYFHGANNSSCLFSARDDTSIQCTKCEKHVAGHHWKKHEGILEGSDIFYIEYHRGGSLCDDDWEEGDYD